MGTTDSAEREPLFTRYLRSLDEDGNPPSEEAFLEAWGALAVALRRELLRRGLWDRPTLYLGVEGGNRWEESSLEELVADLYSFVFVDRVRSLRAQLRVKPQVEGLVFANLRNFLYERQKRYDRLGFRVFEFARSACRDALSGSELELVSGDPTVRNDTVLRAREGLAASPSPAEDTDLVAAAAAWSADLLPDLVTARGSRRQAVIDRLRAHFVELLAATGAERSFQDLVGAVKAIVRTRWSELLERELGESDSPAVEVGGLDLPSAGRSAGPEQWLSFEQLVDCIEELLDRHREREPEGERQLEDLWQVIKLHAEGVVDKPSDRAVSELLTIPRHRLPKLYETLGRFVTTCSSADSASALLGS